MTMHRLVSFLFSLLIYAGPVFAWGEGDCPHSSKKASQDSTAEKVDKTQSRKENK